MFTPADPLKICIILPRFNSAAAGYLFHLNTTGCKHAPDHFISHEQNPTSSNRWWGKIILKKFRKPWQKAQGRSSADMNQQNLIKGATPLSIYWGSSGIYRYQAMPTHRVSFPALTIVFMWWGQHLLFFFLSFLQSKQPQMCLNSSSAPGNDIKYICWEHVKRAGGILINQDRTDPENLLRTRGLGEFSTRRYIEKRNKGIAQK